MSGSKKQSIQIFISHSSIDAWVARQIAHRIEEVGGSVFLDVADIECGDDFEKEMRRAALVSEEILVLLTPGSIKRPYTWLEIGAFWVQEKKIVGVLYGLTASALVAQDGTPALLKRINLVDINQIDSYFDQLKKRIANLREKYED